MVLLLVVAALATATVPTALGGGRAVPKNYTFSFALSAKPQIPVSGYTNVRISGGGSGSFSIAHRQIDRDGTVSWDVVKPRASFWLSAGGKVFVRGTIVGGHYGVEKATGGYSRNVSFTIRITSTSRFHCANPKALLDLQDVPIVQGNSAGMEFGACGTRLQFGGTPPALRIGIKPA